MSSNVRNWKKFNYVFLKQFYIGLKHNEVKPYDESLISKLRHVYDNGLPISLILLSDSFKLDNGFLQSIYIALALEDKDYTLVSANINSFLLNPILIDEKTNDKEYYYLEIKDNFDTEWVIDTRGGYIFKKSLFKQLQKPIVKRKYTKEEVMNMKEYTNVKSIYDVDNEIILNNVLKFERQQFDKDIYTNLLEDEIKKVKEELASNKTFCESKQRIKEILLEFKKSAI